MWRDFFTILYRKLLVSYIVKKLMHTASEGRCHFVSLAGAAKCASNFAVVNLREYAKHTLLYNSNVIVCAGK